MIEIKELKDGTELTNQFLEFGKNVKTILQI